MISPTQLHIDLPWRTLLAACDDNSLVVADFFYSLEVDVLDRCSDASCFRKSHSNLHFHYLRLRMDRILFEREEERERKIEIEKD